jgi:hypothetical protein
MFHPMPTATITRKVDAKAKKRLHPQARHPACRALTPSELGDLADAMAAATGKDEAARLKQRFIDGFYGARPPKT